MADMDNPNWTTDFGALAERLCLKAHSDSSGFAALEEATIAVIEARTGEPLPPDYASFVRHFGKCYAAADLVVVLDTGEEVELSRFYGDEQILRQLAVSYEGQPTSTFQFGSDDFGNAFMLNCATGAVSFQGSECIAFEPQWLAGSFRELLEERVEVFQD